MNLLVGQIKKTCITVKRYWFGSLTDLLFYYIFFMIIFLYTKNMKDLDSTVIEMKITKLIIGYVSWFFFSLTLSFVSNSLYSEMLTGTFEQLSLTGTSIQGIMFVRFLVAALQNILTMIPFTIILLLSTGIRLHLSIQMLWVFLILMMGILGLSFLLGGLTVRFKNTGQLAFIISALFLGTSIINIDYSSPLAEKIALIIPFVKGQDLLKELSVNPNIMTGRMYVVLIINAIIYLMFGLIIFQILYNRTRAKGMLIRY